MQLLPTLTKAQSPFSRRGDSHAQQQKPGHNSRCNVCTLNEVSEKFCPIELQKKVKITQEMYDHIGEGPEAHEPSGACNQRDAGQSIQWRHAESDQQNAQRPNT